MTSPRFIPEKYIKILCRLPLYILLPASAALYFFDYALYQSSGPDEHIYTDVTTRFGMSPGFGIFILAILAGSVALIAAFGTLIMEIKRERRVY